MNFRFRIADFRAACGGASHVGWVAVLLFTRCMTLAADKPIYQPQGAPVDPKVKVAWNRYYDYAETTKLVKAMAAAHPRRAKLQSLGKSYGGREMWLLTITNFDKGQDTDKPAIWAHAGIHANEIQTVEAALYAAWYLLEMYDRSEFITHLVDERTFYFVPMMSPDSRDAHMYRPNSTHSPRGGQRPVDDDRDGRFDEDGPDDLDGDGHITQMRVRDPNGRWKPHPKYPDLMVRGEPDERGEYTLLGSEGFDNDGDGEVDEDGDGYYDPNRDWPWNWHPRSVQSGAYRYPFSIIENRMVADFVAAHQNIAAAQSFHNTGGWILRGPGNKDEQYDAGDVAVYDAIAKRGEQMLPGYKYAVTAVSLYNVYGGEGEWFYEMQGVFRYTNELFTAFNLFRRVSEGDARMEDFRAFDKYLLFGEGTVKWHAVDHPQYGKIEVGGVKKNWGRQPPSFLLEEECHRNMAFLLYHADQMPQVEIQAVEMRRLPSGLVEITATVANPRLTPTHAAVDLKRKITPPDIVSIAGPKARVALGLWSDDRFFEKPTEQRRQPERLRVASVPGMGAVYARWLVSGEGPCTIRVDSPKGGHASREFRW